MAPFTKAEIQEMTEIFLEEGFESLELFEKNIRILEEDYKDKKVLIDLHRIAHSFKGMAGTTGLIAFEKFFHEYESFLTNLQDGMLSVTKEIVDLFYDSLDIIEENLNLTKNQQPCNQKFEIFLIKMEAVKKQFWKDTESTSRDRIKNMFQKSGLEEFSADNLDFEDVLKKCFTITIILEENTRLKLARLLVVIKKIVEFGRIAQSTPVLSEILANHIENQIEILYQTSFEANFIVSKIQNCGEIKDVKIIERDKDTALQILNVEQEKKNEIQQDREVKASTDVSSIKVRLDSLDKLVEVYGEVLISSKQLEKKLEEFDRPDINEILFQMQTYLFDLQDVVMQMQMVPISSVFRIFPRMVRNLAKQHKKEVKFEIRDHNVKVDRKILTDIGDIVNHLLRNAIDHGMDSPEERKRRNKSASGKIEIETKIQNNLLVMTITDDGKGIQTEKLKAKAIEKGLHTPVELDTMPHQEVLNLIFLSNFSTAEKITKISGRGLGLNIVKDKIQNLGGTISFETENGVGSTFRVILPISRLLIKAILVEAQDQIFSIPLDDIERLYEIKMEDIVEKEDLNYIPVDGEEKMIPVYDILQLFSFDGIVEPTERSSIKVVHMKKGEKSFGLIVDDFSKESEIVIKQIDDVRGKISGISGAAILDDGKVSLIIDPFSIQL